MRALLGAQEPPRRALIEALLLAMLLALTVVLIGMGHFLLDLKAFRQAQQQQEHTVVGRAGAVLGEALGATVSD
ncbi:MAG: hypothetical protein GY889_10040, partial [Proteobacteria bacterium]|nr:hypothetical protein [Pseudomonadota bacterium]